MSAIARRSRSMNVTCAAPRLQRFNSADTCKPIEHPRAFDPRRKDVVRVCQLVRAGSCPAHVGALDGDP